MTRSGEQAEPSLTVNKCHAGIGSCFPEEEQSGFPVKALTDILSFVLCESIRSSVRDSACRSCLSMKCRRAGRSLLSMTEQV